MNSNSKYYKSIYERFQNSSNKQIIDQNSKLAQEKSNNEDESDDKLDDAYFSMFKEVLKNTREAKLLRKIHDEMFDIYINKLTYVSYDTAKSYSKMISEFVMYSPEICPDDLTTFLKNKIKLSKRRGTFKSQLQGTSLKYYRCIDGFLRRVYDSGYSVLYPKYVESIKPELKSQDNFPTILEVTNANIELMNMKKFEDALVIHLMYSLNINLETIVLLTFDSIDCENNIKFLDTLEEKYTEVKLNENLMRDIIFFKKIRSENKTRDNSQFRCYKDKAVIIGDFIISNSTTAIYNRFTRCFGGKLKWFKFSSYQILQLSNAKRFIENIKEKHQCLDLVQDCIDINQQRLSKD